MIHTTAWMNLKCIMLNERSQIQKVTDCMIPFTRYLGKSKTAELENRSEGAAANSRGTFGDDRNVLYLHCGYTAIPICQNPENCILKRVDYTVSFFVLQLPSCVRFFANPRTVCSTPGFPVLHYLLEFAQTHVY